MFIDSHFKIVDLNGTYKVCPFVCTVNKIILFLDDGVIAADEFRYNCVTRIPVDNVNILDEAYQNLLNVRSYMDKQFLKIDSKEKNKYKS